MTLLLTPRMESASGGRRVLPQVSRPQRETPKPLEPITSTLSPFDLALFGRTTKATADILDFFQVDSSFSFNKDTQLKPLSISVKPEQLDASPTSHIELSLVSHEVFCEAKLNESSVFYNKDDDELIALAIALALKRRKNNAKN